MLQKLKESPNFRHHKTEKRIISLKKGFSKINYDATKVGNHPEDGLIKFGYILNIKIGNDPC
jgi:hypothetical protein